MIQAQIMAINMAVSNLETRILTDLRIQGPN